MKIAFFTNYLNHHQLPLSLQIDKKTENNFCLVTETPTPRSRRSMGYTDMNKEYPFVLPLYDDTMNRDRANQVVLDSDIVIFGAGHKKYAKMRTKSGKLTLRYSERICKQGLWKAFLPRYIKHAAYRNKPVYMLCASAYTAYDFSIVRAYINKTYKWGYFPEVKKYKLDELFAHKGENVHTSILWCGRMIDWKHPEAAIEVACRLKAAGYDFELNFIGDGLLREKLSNLICEKQLTGHVHLLGSMPPEDVRCYMEAADIFLFTSDFNEGWGAVLNESMNSGCAVVASHAIGSVPFLLKHEENGLIYKNGNLDDLYAKTKRLVESAELRRELGERAYHTMADLWNAEVAAERLLHLIEELQKYGQCDLYEDGPCSRAEVLKNGWFNDHK